MRFLLSRPSIYCLFQRFIGSNRQRRRVLEEWIQPAPDSKILDIGCGAGNIVPFLPKSVYYEGYDMNRDYVEYARRKYEQSGRKTKFHNRRVNAMSVEKRNFFDIVLAYGLLHHLDDEEAADLFNIGFDVLNRGGIMITHDNAYVEGQSPIARYISSKDRGQHVRRPEGYRALAERSFLHVEVHVAPGRAYLPQTICVLRCRKP